MINKKYVSSFLTIYQTTVFILNRHVSFMDHAAFISWPTLGTPSADTVKPTAPMW